MMMYCQIKFDCQRISSSEDRVERVVVDHMSPRCDVDLENGNNFFSSFIIFFLSFFLCFFVVVFFLSLSFFFF